MTTERARFAGFSATAVTARSRRGLRRDGASRRRTTCGGGGRRERPLYRRCTDRLRACRVVAVAVGFVTRREVVVIGDTAYVPATVFDELVARATRAEGALRRIVAKDYRGNESEEQRIAREALAAAWEDTP